MGPASIIEAQIYDSIANLQLIVDDTYAHPSPGIRVSFAVFSLEDQELGESFCRFMLNFRA
jgi:hypothetical protein